MNNVSIIGNITRDLELKEFGSLVMFPIIDTLFIVIFLIPNEEDD